MRLLAHAVPADGRSLTSGLLQRRRRGRPVLVGLLLLGVGSLLLTACETGQAPPSGPAVAPPGPTTSPSIGPAMTPQSFNLGPVLPVPVAPAPVGTGDWPMYGHDVSHTSYNPVEALIGLDTVTQLVPRWQVDLGTSGLPPFNAPSVAGGRVYVGSSVAQGPNFFAFDATSGALVWNANLGYQDGCFKVGIGSTAAISGTVVVVGGGDAAYYGLDSASGHILWRQALDAGGSGFAWTSPLLAAGAAYLGISSDCDNPSVRGELRAVNLLDGTVQGSQYFVPAGQAGAGIWNSPALSPDGRNLVAVTGEDYNGYNGPYNRAMISLDPLTLAITQADQQGGLGQDFDFGTSPVIFHDRQNRTLVGAGHKDNHFYVYDLAHIADGPLWQRPIGPTIGMMPAYDPNTGDGGTFFFLDGDGKLFAVDPATGADRWPAQTVGATHGNLALANGLIFVNVSDGGVLALEAATGRTVTVLLPEHKGASSSGPAVAGGFVYWQSGTYLNAWSLPVAATASPAR
jgi:outer membrane protein assembly factor BamB